jgi:putative acyl-CoA dehydrogenase
VGQDFDEPATSVRDRPPTGVDQSAADRAGLDRVAPPASVGPGGLLARLATGVVDVGPREAHGDDRVEAEAATALGIRLASAVDGLGRLDHREREHEVALRRIALPLAKFWVCKRTPAMVAEALECLGGNGYVEDSGLPLMFRESPLNSIWEGSGNVNALDVLRALGREPEVLQAWITEVGAARGADSRLDRAVDDTLALLGEGAGLEAGARRLAGRMAACLQGSLLVRFAPAEVADAFCGSRFGTSYGGTFGMLDSGSLREVVDRAIPRP